MISVKHLLDTVTQGSLLLVTLSFWLHYAEDFAAEHEGMTYCCRLCTRVQVRYVFEKGIFRNFLFFIKWGPHQEGNSEEEAILSLNVTPRIQNQRRRDA